MTSLRSGTLILAVVGALVAAPRGAAAQDGQEAPPQTAEPPPPDGQGAPPPAAYPPPPPAYGYPAPAYGAPVTPRGYHEHDGTYVRLQLGPGYLRLAASEGGDDYQAKGFGANFDVAVGGAVAPNFILYGAFLFADASSPTVYLDGMSLGSSSGGLDVVGFGAGAAYYFPEANVFVLGTIYAARIEGSDSNGNTVQTSNLGWALEGEVGKEWWVSTDWGLGLAGQVVGGRMADQGGSPTWSALSFGLLFSATYN